MKFELSSIRVNVELGDSPDELYKLYPALKDYSIQFVEDEYTYEGRKAHLTYIDIDTLEDLLILKEDLDEDLIISTNKRDNTQSIQIYDDWL